MKNIVVLSGGLDSSVTLAVALDSLPRGDIHGLFFSYGQRHYDQELSAARGVADYYNIPLEVYSLEGIMSGGSLLGDGDIPREGYRLSNMSSTVVEGRNLLFASVAIARVAPEGVVWVGVHGGDHALYPDCHPEFWEAVTTAAGAYEVKIKAPFLNRSKTHIVGEGEKLGFPFHLTYSCYEGGELHCGECGTCRERKDSFLLSGVEDPTEYTS